MPRRATGAAKTVHTGQSHALASIPSRRRPNAVERVSHIVRHLPEGPLRESAFLVLAALAGHSQPGRPLLDEIERLSEGRVHLRTGTLHALLERLRGAGLVYIHRDEADGDIRPHYRLSEAGLAALSTESDARRRWLGVVDGLLDRAPDRRPLPGVAGGPADRPAPVRPSPAFYRRPVGSAHGRRP